jgi:hypothetical protein
MREIHIGIERERKTKIVRERDRQMEKVRKMELIRMETPIMSKKCM